MSVDWLVVPGVVAVGLWVLWRPSRRDKRSSGLWLVLVIFGVLLALDWVAISTDFRDADGIVDCHEDCSTLQNFIQYTFWPALLLFPLLWFVLFVRALTESK